MTKIFIVRCSTWVELFSSLSFDFTDALQDGENFVRDILCKKIVADVPDARFRVFKAAGDIYIEYRGKDSAKEVNWNFKPDYTFYRE